MEMKFIFWIIVIVIIFKACSDGEGNINAGLEASTFNVYFYFPDGKEYYLGKSRGLSQCQGMARSFANQKSSDNADRYGWSYICCLQTSTSSCASKHK
jgi:hypothetical protein